MPSVLYVSYDGALDPLGYSQVVPYLAGLARGAQVTLLSFEKAQRFADVPAREAMATVLKSAGIDWRPLRYHARPRLAATAWDVARGALAIARTARATSASLVHCRGEVAMLMARTASLPAGTRLLLDMRGFFRDERVESGSWRAGSLLDRIVCSAETANLRRADGLVVLTAAALGVLEAGGTPVPPHRVIPTCVDTARFTPAPATAPRPFSAVYSGSLGTWYMLEEMVALARAISTAIPGKALFLTPDGAQALRAGATPDWAEVRAASHAEVPQWMQKARAAFFLIRPTPAKRASCPTKLGEALASGLPVVANRGIGDVDGLLEKEGVGVLLDEIGEAGYCRAAARLAELVADPGTAARCRRVAETRFALDAGVAAYRALYAELGARAS